MGYNHGKAERIFQKQWSEKEKLYRDLNMSQEQIDSIYEFDRRQFNADRKYYENCVIGYCGDGVCNEEFQNINIDTWIEAFDEEIYIKLKKFSGIQLKAFYLYKICGYTQDEISSKLMKPRRTIAYWISKIDEVLRF